MAKKVNVQGRVRGDTMKWKATFRRRTSPITTTPIDITTAKIWMTLKVTPDDADTDAIWQGSSDDALQINKTDPANGIAIITIPGSATAVLASSQNALYYDIQLLESDGTLTTTQYGWMYFDPDATRAIS